MMRPRPPAESNFGPGSVHAQYLPKQSLPVPKRLPMKTIRRFALVLALTLGAAACSTNITGPDWEAPEHMPDGGGHMPDGGGHMPDGGG